MAIENDMKNEEMTAIEELRSRFGEGDIEPEMHEDVFFFRRFLAARNFDLDKAEKMIKKHLEWRKKNDVENVLLTFKIPEIIEKYCPYYNLGYDKEGCTIRYASIGAIDITGILSSVKSEQVIRTVMYELEFALEEVKEQSKKYKRNIDKIVGIADITNLSFTHVTDKRAIYLFIQLLHLAMNNYPGRLKAVYIVNASLYFSFVYSLMKSVLPASVLNKIHVYSDDSYKEELLEVIDSDVLPAFLGGSKTDPDGNPLCLTFGIRHEVDAVPVSCYLKTGKRSLSKLPEVKKATLTRANFHEIKLEVKEPGSYLEWEFETKSRDVGFGLFYEEIVDGEEKITELVPIQRIDTEHYPETGTIKCENLGTYVIVFDNTYSWVRGKEIYYRTKIISSKEREAQLKE